VTSNEIALVISLACLAINCMFCVLTVRNARKCKRYAAEAQEHARRVQELLREMKRQASVMSVNATNQSIRDFIDGR